MSFPDPCCSIGTHHAEEMANRLPRSFMDTQYKTPFLHIGDLSLLNGSGLSTLSITKRSFRKLNPSTINTPTHSHTWRLVLMLLFRTLYPKPEIFMVLSLLSAHTVDTLSAHNQAECWSATDAFSASGQLSHSMLRPQVNSNPPNLPKPPVSSMLPDALNAGQAALLDSSRKSPGTS